MVETYHEEKMPCPACGKDAIVRHIVKKIPYYGEVRLLSISCPHCGYRYSDVRVITDHPKKTIEKRIRTKKDLSAMLVLTSQAKVSIPELGLEVLPGPIAKGRMLPVSALLQEFMDAIKLSLKSDDITDEERRRGEYLIKKLEEELENPSGDITVVVEDESGRSDIIPEEVRSRRAEKERR